VLAYVSIYVSLMSISIAGKSAAVFYSSEIFSSRISAEFTESVIAQHFRLPLGPVVTLLFTVDVSESNFSFCDKLDFIIDSLCRVDVVLGREWINVCRLNNFWPEPASLLKYNYR